MDRWSSEFCGEVLSHMPRATKKERAAMLKELRDHMEDAAEAMEAGGFSWEEAREKAAQAMGDPAEIGRALNTQLSPFWLWVGRGSKAVAVCLLCLLATTLYSRHSGVRELDPGGPEAPLPVEGYLCKEVGVRLAVDMVKAQIYRMELSPDGKELVLDCAFWTTEQDRYNREELGAFLETKSPNGDWDWLHGTGGELSRKKTDYISVTVPVEPGQNSICLRLRRTFEEAEVEIPIDGGEWYEADPEP